MKPGVSLLISVGRGILISGFLILVLPSLFSGNAMWFAMPITEVIVAIFVIILIIKYTKKLPLATKS